MKQVRLLPALLLALMLAVSCVPPHHAPPRPPKPPRPPAPPSPPHGQLYIPDTTSQSAVTAFSEK